jgi:uncharacterized protein
VQKLFLSPLVRNPETQWVLRNTRNERSLADRVLGAFDSKTRRTGLLGRDTFEPGHALFIAPSNAVHTCFMRFPIDVLFVRRDGTVVSARHALRPWRLAASLRAYAVIELPAGTLEQCDTRPGDRLELVSS